VEATPSASAPSRTARLRARRGANEATIAVCHSILTAVWHMLQTGETYTDPGADFFARRDPERTRKRLVDQLQRLGYTVTLQESAPAT
jgi:transposase